MNRLEQYIRENKSRLDEEPIAGHFERLQQKMNHEQHRFPPMWGGRGERPILRWGVSIAASIVLLLSVGIIWHYAGKQDDRMAICESTFDMKVCYLDKMNAVASQIVEHTKDMDEWDQQQVMTDVQNIIDAANSGLESELPEELPEYQTKSILSDYYRQNLESLEMIEKRVKSEE